MDRIQGAQSPSITATALNPCECLHLEILGQHLVHELVMLLKREASEAEKQRMCNGPGSFGYAHSVTDKQDKRGVSAAIIRRAPVKPRVHAQAGLSTVSTAWYGTVHNSEHMDMENEDKEHGQITEIVNGDIRIGLFGTSGGLIVSKDYFKAAFCTSTISYPLSNLPLASSGQWTFCTFKIFCERPLKLSIFQGNLY